MQVRGRQIDSSVSSQSSSGNTTGYYIFNVILNHVLPPGRVGQSWFAESFVSDAVIASMRAFSQTNTSPDNQLEITNMKKVAQRMTEKEREAKQALAAAQL